MYNVKLHSYVPKPQPATSDRIVAAHYYAAWKKGAAGIHEGFNDLAEEYPDRTPLMGYYDEENPEVCDEIERKVRENMHKIVPEKKGGKAAAKSTPKSANIDIEVDDEGAEN